MNTEHLRRVVGRLHPYVKYSHLARVSGSSKQTMNYWLHNQSSKSSFSPEPGLRTLRNLAERLHEQSPIDQKDFDEFRKFINISAFMDLFSQSISTVTVNLDTYGAEYYEKEIKQMCKHILSELNLKPKPKLRPKKRVKKPVVLKLRKS